MKKLSDVLKQSVAGSEVLRGGRAQIALRRWPEVVGPFLAEHCQPDQFDRGVLWVSASGSAWAQELRMQKDVVLARLNDHAGEPLFLQMRVGVRKPRKDWTLDASKRLEGDD